MKMMSKMVVAKLMATALVLGAPGCIPAGDNIEADGAANPIDGHVCGTPKPDGKPAMPATVVPLQNRANLSQARAVATVVASPAQLQVIDVTVVDLNGVLVDAQTLLPVEDEAAPVFE